VFAVPAAGVDEGGGEFTRAAKGKSRDSTTDERDLEMDNARAYIIRHSGIKSRIDVAY